MTCSYCGAEFGEKPFDVVHTYVGITPRSPPVMRWLCSECARKPDLTVLPMIVNLPGGLTDVVGYVFLLACAAFTAYLVLRR